MEYFTSYLDSQTSAEINTFQVHSWQELTMLRLQIKTFTEGSVGMVAKRQDKHWLNKDSGFNPQLCLLHATLFIASIWCVLTNKQVSEGSKNSE